MTIALRHGVLAVTVLAVSLAYAGSRLFPHGPADPCETTPQIHACAVFLQSESLMRRVEAGRLAVPVSRNPAAQTHGAITFSDVGAAIREPSAPDQTGL